MTDEQDTSRADARSHSNGGFDHATVDDLAALVRRLAHSLRQAAPDNDLPEKALDYLRRKGLQGSPLRKGSNVKLTSGAHDAPEME